jgi:GNAT superfamily N-acetyltransferase
LENIFVEEDYRSSGIGEALSREFFSWSKTNGAVSVLVSAYFLNERAIAFYKSVGFVPYSLKLEAKLE